MGNKFSINQIITEIDTFWAIIDAGNDNNQENLVFKSVSTTGRFLIISVQNILESLLSLDTEFLKSNEEIETEILQVTIVQQDNKKLFSMSLCEYISNGGENVLNEIDWILVRSNPNKT